MLRAGMQGPYISAAFGLASAASYGTADFSGGLVSKRSHVFGVLAVARSSGLVVMIVLAGITREHLPSASALLLGCSAGLVGGVALPALYRALAIGKMGIAAPVTSVLSAGLPVVVGVLSEGLPRLGQSCGLILAIIALWFISRPEGGLRPRGLGLAISAGLGFGAFLVLIREACAVAIYWPQVAALAVSLIVATIILIVQRGSLPEFRLMPIALVAGVLDSLGNFFFVMAGRQGRLDVAAVLCSLYPAVTILLARLVLRERITRVQAIGMTAALIALPLITTR
jgi:drug/metabolite transporter (DMT)-like permease